MRLYLVFDLLWLLSGRARVLLQLLLVLLGQLEVVGHLQGEEGGYVREKHNCVHRYIPDKNSTRVSH